MKRYLLFMIMVLVPSLLMAQAAGGAIKRQTNKKQNTRQINPKAKTSTTKPAEESIYNVIFNCNVPSAVVFIDGKTDGYASGDHYLKRGSHSVTLNASGYEPLSQTILVNTSSTSFTFNLKKDLSTLPWVIQKLINNMVHVEGGTFTMGATSEQRGYPESIENTPHLVTLKSFSIGKYEVTQEEWEAVMGKNPSRYYGTKNPVHGINWEDCQEFIRKLNNMTGRNFRLPTEAEWEYAARGGKYSRGYKYAGSNNLNACAWYDENSGAKPHEVGQKQPNEIGLYDMSGNVSELCNDWYGSYGSASVINPVGPPKGYHRVYRGGDSYFSGMGCYVSYRHISVGFGGLRLAQ